MEESTSQPSTPISFDLPDDIGYAVTETATCEAVEFLMTKLEQVNIDDLDTDNQICPICQERFHVSEDITLSHAPVKTVCGHIFGNKCIIRWLDPLCLYREDSNDALLADPDAPLFEISKSSCPKCREVFFPEPYKESMRELRLRLWLWDAAYARAGVARSEKEERSRKYLWQYVEYCELFAESDIPESHVADAVVRRIEMQVLLRTFAQFLSTLNLTPAQESRRQQLEQIDVFDLMQSEIDHERIFRWEPSREHCSVEGDTEAGSENDDGSETVYETASEELA